MATEVPSEMKRPTASAKVISFSFGKPDSEKRGQPERLRRSERSVRADPPAAKIRPLAVESTGSITDVALDLVPEWQQYKISARCCQKLSPA
jgi:hypothetical protein